MPDPSVRVLAQGRPLKLDRATIDAHPGPTQLRFQRWGLQTLRIHPLFDGERPIGTLMAFTSSRPWSAAAEAWVEETAALFQTPVARALNLESLKRREKDVLSAEAASKSIFSFLERVSGLSSVAAVLQLTTNQFLNHLGFDFATVLLLEGETLALRRSEAASPQHAERARAVEDFMRGNGFPLQVAAGASVLALLQNSPLFFPDAMEILSYPMSERDRGVLERLQTPRTFIILPLRSQERAIGVLWLATLEAVQPLPDPRRDLLTRLAGFVGSAITHAGTYEAVAERDKEIEALNASLQEKVAELHELAFHDSLTGLHNFGAFQAELARRMSEYGREAGLEKLAVAIIDVDHFKRFNDSHGHLAGNVVLQQVAARIQEVARRMDLPCRYGGEEFVVILPKCNLEGAQLFAERLRQRIADQPFEFEGGHAKVTVSIGSTCFDGLETMAHFLQRADAALYAAKAGGRNRSVIAAPTGDAPPPQETGAAGL